MTLTNANKTLLELNPVTSIRAIRGRSWLAANLILLAVPNAFAESDFSAFWKRFKLAVVGRENTTIGEMTKVPLSMSYLEKPVKNKADFLRRYNEIFKGEANAPQCFGSAKPQKESAKQYKVYCPFKE